MGWSDNVGVLIYLLVFEMSVQAVVPFEINGERFFTHTSWLSEKQYNAWSSIPEENKNLALYYSLTTASLFAIFFRKTSLVRTAFTSYGKIFTAAAATLGGGYLGWLAVLKSQERDEFIRVVSKNECGSTPLWRNEESVINLRDKDYKTFMSRRDGRKYNLNDVKSYRPDSVLLGDFSKPSLEKLA